MADTHRMVWTAGLWVCPICGRRLRLTPHLYLVEVVEPGDLSALHYAGAPEPTATLDAPPPWLAGALEQIAAELRQKGGV